MSKRKDPPADYEMSSDPEPRRAKLSEEPADSEPASEASSDTAAQKAKERMERWKALQGRAVPAPFSHTLALANEFRKNPPK
jgi:hypothetical protein